MLKRVQHDKSNEFNINNYFKFLQSVFQKISNNQRFALANQFHPRAKT